MTKPSFQALPLSAIHPHFTFPGLTVDTKIPRVLFARRTSDTIICMHGWKYESDTENKEAVFIKQNMKALVISRLGLRGQILPSAFQRKTEELFCIQSEGDMLCLSPLCTLNVSESPIQIHIFKEECCFILSPRFTFDRECLTVLKSCYCLSYYLEEWFSKTHFSEW